MKRLVCSGKPYESMVAVMRALRLRAKDPRAYSRLAPEARRAAELAEAAGVPRPVRWPPMPRVPTWDEILAPIHPNVAALLDWGAAGGDERIERLPYTAIRALAELPDWIGDYVRPPRGKGRPQAPTTRKRLILAQRLKAEGKSPAQIATRLYPGKPAATARDNLRKFLDRNAPGRK